MTPLHVILFLSALMTFQAYATTRLPTPTPMEWESAAPIDELIDEDSGNVKFYLENPEASVEANEKIPQGYIPHSDDKNIEVLFKDSQERFPGLERKPAESDSSEGVTDRLKAIEQRLNDRNPQSITPSHEPSFWNELGGAISDSASQTYDKAKDTLGQVYKGIFSPPPDLVFGESVNQVAIIQSSQGYVPQKIPLLKGVKARVHISGVEDKKHAFVADAFNIHRSIKGNHGVTVIEFTPDNVGLYKFYDPINRVEGWFLVR